MVDDLACMITCSCMLTMHACIYVRTCVRTYKHLFPLSTSISKQRISGEEGTLFFSVNMSDQIQVYSLAAVTRS